MANLKANIIRVLHNNMISTVGAEARIIDNRYPLIHSNTMSNTAGSHTVGREHVSITIQYPVMS